MSIFGNHYHFTMKRIAFIVTLILMLTTSAAAVPPHPDRTGSWHEDKYSMFIHFGLYSYYGGVWDGKPVTRGYSEQIQSHAGIYSDWYASAAADFDPRLFDAEEIASLAKKAGMRSIIFTSKHHDGFCMFDTQTTGYDSVEMTPSGRDYVKELSQACSAAGLNFGLYFSLIDWNYPHAYPISSHNADFITPQHHQLNMKQIEELVTGYGNISELWFDMGSLTPDQSRDLYELVKKHQPQCMVSGRLGNDIYDFAVMPDNFYPDGTLQAPWQSAASMFDETWSWRSWQERGESKDKAAEKLNSLIHVVSHGGNYLLNIGPDSDGAVIPFEREVLLAIGKWLEANGEAVYGTEPSPFRHDFPWGAVTRKGNRMYLILNGQYPDDGSIIFSLPGNRLKKVLSSGVKGRTVRGQTFMSVSEDMFGDPLDIKVVTLEFEKVIEPVSSSSVLTSDGYMTGSDAVKDYSYSCFDYYSNYKSTVGYSWTFDASQSDMLSMYFTLGEQGRKVSLEVDGSRSEVVLEGEESSVPMAEYTMGPARFMRMRSGTFIGPSQWEIYTDEGMAQMRELASDVVEFPVYGSSNYLLVRNMKVSKPGFVMLQLCAGNGVELVVDGEPFMKHLSPYGTSRRIENVILPLEAGNHQIALRAYNRLASSLEMSLMPSDAPVLKMDIPLEKKNMKVRKLRISAADVPSVHTDCGLHNVFIGLKR